MIITRTPVRVSFFGGGTDYPAYYLRHGGATLVTAINRYVYVTVQHLTEFFEHRIKVHYSKVEAVQCLDHVQIPNVREALRLLGIEDGVEIHLVSDLPARTGLGSSSATTVGLLKALRGHLGQVVSDLQVARDAIHVEQEMVGERVGSQDQYVCACGGFLHVRFMPSGEISIEPLPISQSRLDELNQRLLMVYTGFQRTAHEVLGEQLQNTRKGQLDSELAIMKSQVSRAIDVLADGGPLRRFGELLHQAWDLKRRLSSQVSNPTLDELYKRAYCAGAVGGKLLGAGGGGFLILFVEPDRQQRVREALSPLKEVRFAFEPRGTQIIYYNPANPS